MAGRKLTPAEYAVIVEKGSKKMNVGGRPLFRRTFLEYRKQWEAFAVKARGKIKEAWR